MGPDELMADLDRELRNVLGALATLAPVTEDVTVTDDAGAVRVTVRPDTTLAAVAVVPNWQEKVEPADLATLIGEVLGRAQARAMGFDIDALEAAESGEAPEVDQAQVDAARDALLKEKTEELLAPVSEDTLQARVDALPDMIENLGKRLDVESLKMQNLSDADLPQDPEDFEPDESVGEWVHTANRMVGVRVFAGLVSEVSIKESWLAGRSGNVLTESFTEIIEQLPEVVAAQNKRGDSL